jgi:hypothetical protein
LFAWFAVNKSVWPIDRRGAPAGRRQHSEKTKEWKPRTTPNTRKGGFDFSKRFAVLLLFFMAEVVFLIFIMAQPDGQLLSM